MTKRFIYTHEHLKFLEEEYKRFNVRNLTAEFNRKFNLSKSENSIKACLNNHKITCGRMHSNRLADRIKRKYTDEQVSWVKEKYKLFPAKELVEKFNRKFETNITATKMKALITNRKIQSGRTGRFEKGNVPWTKGKKGTTKPNSGNFKKGHVPVNVKPMFHERIDKYGYINIKIHEKNPYTKCPTRYKQKHIWIWEQANGPVPEGHKIMFIDGDKMNCSMDNLICVSNSLCLRLNKHNYSFAPPELKESIMALARMEVKMFRKQKKIKNY